MRLRYRLWHWYCDRYWEKYDCYPGSQYSREEGRPQFIYRLNRYGWRGLWFMWRQLRLNDLYEWLGERAYSQGNIDRANYWQDKAYAAWEAGWECHEGM